MNASVSQLTNLLGVKSLPSLAVQILIQSHNENWVTHVDKSVPNVAVVLQINWQVEKVIPSLMLCINPLQQHLLSILVGDVFDHDSGACVHSFNDLQQV